MKNDIQNIQIICRKTGQIIRVEKGFSSLDSLIQRFVFLQYHYSEMKKEYLVSINISTN